MRVMDHSGESAEAWDLLCFQFFFQHPQTGAAQIVIIDPSDDLRLFRDDLRFAIFTPCGSLSFVLDAGLACFHGAAFAPGHSSHISVFGKWVGLFSPFFSKGFFFCAE